MAFLALVMNLPCLENGFSRAVTGSQSIVGEPFLPQEPFLGFKLYIPKLPSYTYIDSSKSSIRRFFDLASKFGMVHFSSIGSKLTISILPLELTPTKEIPKIEYGS